MAPSGPCDGHGQRAASATRAAASSDPGILDPGDPSADRIAILRAWLRLQASLHLDPVRATALLQRTSDPEEVLRLASTSARLSPQQLDARIELLRRHRIRAVPLPSSSYPARLRAQSDAPPLLLVRGCADILQARGVAIVGARAATVYGLGVARELASALASAGVVVISGLARGVDAAAHQAALDASGPTLAFSACGPERTYPAEHAELAREICEGGAVVSEMPPGTPPRAAYFPLRNRLIAGLAEVVVVVEGRARSGSLVTARKALDQGVEVMAVPGPISAVTSRGPNLLLRDGAAPVLGPEDVLRALGIEESVPGGGARSVPRQHADVRCRAVLSKLAREPATRDDLARALGWSLGELAVALLELELAGDVQLDRDGRLHVARARGTS